MEGHIIPIESARHFLYTKLMKDFGDSAGNIDFDTAVDEIFGSHIELLHKDRYVRDLQLALDAPQTMLHQRLIWEYVGLKLVNMFRTTDKWR